MDNLYVPRMVWRVLCEEIIKRLCIKTLNIFKWWGGSIKSFAPFCYPIWLSGISTKKRQKKIHRMPYAIQWIFTLLFHPLEYSSLFTWYLSETIISNSFFYVNFNNYYAIGLHLLISLIWYCINYLAIGLYLLLSSDLFWF